MAKRGSGVNGLLFLVVNICRMVDASYYENVVIKNSSYYSDIRDILEIVRKFIVRNDRLLVGGMSIDMALRIKNAPPLYSDDVLPDYDFLSPQHADDAYALAEWLHRLGYKNISVINALHPSTMKVRVNFIPVADITYIPAKILEHVPFLRYKQFRIIHPHVQMISQHHALCYPYENVPRETIMGSRPKKDMERYDTLYELYPLRILNVRGMQINLFTKTIPSAVLKGQCMSGFYALNHWIALAKSMGYKPTHSFGGHSVQGDTLKFTMPVDSHGLTIYSNNLKELYDMIHSVYKPREERFYNRFLDQLPRKIIMDNQWELLDNHQKISAHAHSVGDGKNGAAVPHHVANLQHVMMYLLVNYILLMKIKGIRRGYSFYVGYLECRALVEWAAGEYVGASGKRHTALRQFLPTEQYYGDREFGDSYIVSKWRFDVKNKKIVDDSSHGQPRHAYDTDMKNGHLPRGHFKFDYRDSIIFQFDGGQTESFL